MTGEGARPWRRRGGGPLVLGHRGSSRRRTENTVEAFLLAREEGADGVELDVRRCASGEVVVFHDDDLVRLAGRPGRVEDMTWGQLRDVALTRGGRIPLLDEVIDALPGEFLINVELKVPSVRTVGSLAAAVTARVGEDPRPGRFLLSSFHPVAVWRVMQLTPGVRAAVIFAHDQQWALREAVAADVLRTFAVHPEHVLVTPSTLARWRRLGFGVNTWTVDDPGRIEHLARLGVDGIITNDPALARRTLG